MDLTELEAEIEKMKRLPLAERARLLQEMIDRLERELQETESRSSPAG